MRPVMKWALVGVMVLHGLIHLMGFIEALNIAQIAALTGQTIIPVDGVPLVLAGITWMLTCVLLLAGAILLATRHKEWRRVALAGVLVSQLLIIVWWPAAAAGTVANLVIIAAVVWDAAAETRARERPVVTP